MPAETLDGEALRREVEALRAEIARLNARVPMRWQVDPDPYSKGWSEWACEWACAWACGWVFAAVGVGIAWVVAGHDPRVIRSAWVTAALAAVWCAAFVRRVPR